MVREGGEDDMYLSLSRDVWMMTVGVGVVKKWIRPLRTKFSAINGNLVLERQSKNTRARC